MWFLFTAFCIYFVPGYVVLTLLGTKRTVAYLLSLPVGMALWGWQGWIGGWIGNRNLSMPYLLIFFIAFLILGYRNRGVKKKIQVSRNPIDPVSLGLIVVGVALQFLIVFNVLVPWNGSWRSCCIDENDTTWYAAITLNLTKQFPPDYPGLAGQTLKNYHFWSMLVVADAVRVFRVNQWPFQFQFSGLLLSALLGISLWAFSDAIGASKVFRRWLLFFSYVGGDAIYLISLATKHTIGFPGSSLEDGVRFLGNPPRAYAYVLAITWYTLFVTWRKELTLFRSVVLALLIGALVGFKIYVAFFVITGLVVLTLVDMFRRNFSTVRLLIFSGLASAAVYLPLNYSAGGLFFTGFWRFQDFIVQPQFGLIRLELARKIFEADNKYMKVLAYDLLFLGVYILTIFGTKLVGFLLFKKARRLISVDLHIMLASSLFISAVLGFFFQQTFGGSNTFNFLVNVFLFFSIYAASALAGLQQSWKKRSVIALLICSVVLLTVPRSIYETVKTWHYSLYDLWAIEPPDLHLVFEWLRNNTDDTDLVASIHNHDIIRDDIGPYVYNLTGRNQYLSAAAMMRQIGGDTFDREKNLAFFASSKNARTVGKVLRNTGIRWIIISDAMYSQPTGLRSHTTPVFRTPTFTVLSVVK